MRKNLVYKKKVIYYFVMLLNLVLRFFWILNVSNATSNLIELKFLKLTKPYMNFLICIIELIRRIIWNLFRVEFEHTKNCGKLNAVM